jgi:hypothetical protein
VLWVGFPQLNVSAEAAASAMHMPDHNNTYELGKLLYTEYLYPIRGRGRDPAGGHDRRHCPDPA